MPPEPLVPHASHAAPDAARPPPPVLFWGLGFAAAAASGGTVALALGNPDLYQRPLRIVLLAWTTLPFILAGMIAWRARPDSRFGTLLIVAGFVTPLSTLQWLGQPLLNTIGQLCDLLLPALWLHVFLAYPTGRVTGRVARAVVGAAYAAALGLQLVVLALGGFDDRHLLAITNRPGAAETVQNVQLLAITALCVAGVVVLWHRRLTRPPAPRRPVALLIDSFGAALIMVAVLMVAGSFALPGFEILRLVTFGVVGLAPLAFLVGLLDARLARSGVGEMMVRLEAGSPADLRGIIAQALRDPSLTLAYWLPQYGTWADESGAPVTLPGPDDPRGVTVIHQGDEPLAALLYHPSLRDEPRLVEAVKAAAAIALENGRLHAELHARLQELHGSRARVIEVAQKERQRLERNLHDGAQQRLIALALELGMLENRLDGDERRRVELARREIAVSLDELRQVARGIHPAVVSGHGLAVALESVVARMPMRVDLRVADLPRLSETIEVAAYYVVCESLANVGKHARATAVEVDVRLSGGVLLVQVADDGIGGADTERGTGLRGLADRVEALDGRLRIWTPAGGGTCVRAEMPCGS